MFSHVMIGTNELEKAKLSMMRCWVPSAFRRAGWTAIAFSIVPKPAFLG